MLPLASSFSGTPARCSPSAASSPRLGVGPRREAGPLSRRAALSFLAASPLAASAATVVGKPQPLSESDPLTKSLRESRASLGGCSAFLRNKKWDQIRPITKELLTKMTFSGYTGESVKARAAAWSYAGEAALSKAILTRRLALIKAINVLENGVFAQETSDKKKMLSTEELQAALAAVAAELDSLLPLLGCEQRWSNGKCEILPPPEDRSMADLISFSKF